MKYTSDLTDEEWVLICPYLPPRTKTRPMNWSYRCILDAIFYQLKNGCMWRNLPKDFPPYSTVYWHYKQLRDSGVIGKINEELHKKVRLKEKKKSIPPCL